MENPAANQLPEVDSLPDGFVEITEDTLAPQTPAQGVEHASESETEKVLDMSLIPCLSSTKERLELSVEDADKDCVEHDTSISVSEASARMPDCSNAKDQVEDLQPVHRKDIISSKSNETLKSSKQEASDVKRKTVKHTFKSEREYLEFTLKYQQVLSERDGAIAVRDKLESLCRELHRQNKMLMDECKKVSMEGQNLRLELSNKFQYAIKDVSIKLEEQKNESLAQLKENEMLRNKLKQFVDQYTLAEQQFAQKERNIKMILIIEALKHKTLELQIVELKIKQHEEKSIQEQSQMKFYEEQVSQLLATEKNLRLQLSADGEKFQQFQEALLKSNEVFAAFKLEIKKMEKSIKELKKENTFLKSKSEKSDVTLIELVEERERLKKQVDKVKNQKEKLESLCRSLQAERKQIKSGCENSDSASV